MHPARNKEIYGIVSYLIFSCHFTLLLKETSACGSQVGHIWVTSGLLTGSTGVTHFNSDTLT